MNLYREQLKGIRFFTDQEGAAYHLCVVQLDFKMPRASFMKKLENEGIGTQVHYIPIYKFPVFSKRSGDISSYFPEMEAYYASALSLPLYYDMSKEDVGRVSRTLEAML